MTSAPGELAAITARLRAAGCVFAEDEARLLAGSGRSPAEVAAMVERRAAGYPLEHVLGWAEFCGLRVAVSDGVFVPRRRSEFLVKQAIMAAVARQPPGEQGLGAAPIVVIDLCCGSGAVGVAVAAGLRAAGLAADLHAADIDPAAVTCARRNVVPAGGQVYQGDLFDPLPAALRGCVDLIVVNAPYVPSAEIALMPAEARLHEPLVALDGGPDGVAVHRRAAAAAPAWLAPGGCLLIETSARQAAATAAAMTGSGLTATVAEEDELGATVVTGSRPADRGRRL